MSGAERRARGSALGASRPNLAAGGAAVLAVFLRFDSAVTGERLDAPQLEFPVQYDGLVGG